MQQELTTSAGNIILGSKNIFEMFETLTSGTIDP